MTAQSIQLATESVCTPTAHSHETVHRFVVAPADVGIHGFVDGGTLLDWIDGAAHTTATRWCGGHCVAASIGNLHLDRPIGVGDLVAVRTSLVYTGRSSMHVLVTVCSTTPTLAAASQTAQCSIIFVAVDDEGRPVEVPPWTPGTMLELQRHRQARVRASMRQRIEAAMAAQSYTAGGSAPSTTLRLPGAAAKSAGRVMRWIDDAACVCGAKWTGADVITSYVAGIRFCRPVVAGEVVEVTARLVHTRQRSIHVGIHVATQDECIALGLAVVVSLDECGDARPVRPWQPAFEQDRRLSQHARHLIGLREFIEPFTTASPDVLQC
jgi:acyl-CoA hydrolase